MCVISCGNITNATSDVFSHKENSSTEIVEIYIAAAGLLLAG